jgi:uncharacterized membrane protein YagU involved in acid resistance
MSPLSKSIWAGAIAGLAGAYAMNQYQSLANVVSKELSGKQALNQDQDATIQTARAISRIAFDHQLTECEEKWAVPAVHYSLGTGLGALYGFVAEKLPICTAGVGTAYGAAVWLGADEILAPAMGFTNGPAETNFSAHVNALTVHLIFGVVTSLTHQLVLGAF